MAIGSGNASTFVGMEIAIPPKVERELRKTLGEIEPGVRRQLSNKLRSGLNAIGADVARRVPNQAPMSGMTERWGSAVSSIKTYPAAPPGKAIATIRISAGDSRFARLLSITELAGSVSKGFTKRGRHMINVLQDRAPLVGRGGRFVWKAWLKARPGAVGIAISAINEFVVKFNGKS